MWVRSGARPINERYDPHARVVDLRAGNLCVRIARVGITLFAAIETTPDEA